MIVQCIVMPRTHLRIRTYMACSLCLTAMISVAHTILQASPAAGGLAGDFGVLKGCRWQGAAGYREHHHIPQLHESCSEIGCSKRKGVVLILTACLAVTPDIGLGCCLCRPWSAMLSIYVWEGDGNMRNIP